MLLSLVYFVRVVHQREVIEFLADSVQCKGTIFVILKQGGCALQNCLIETILLSSRSICFG